MLTTIDVAKKLGVHYMTVYTWIRKGILPAIQIDRLYRIDENEFDKFLKTKKVKVKS